MEVASRDDEARFVLLRSTVPRRVREYLFRGVAALPRDADRRVPGNVSSVSGWTSSTKAGSALRFIFVGVLSALPLVSVLGGTAFLSRAGDIELVFSLRPCDRARSGHLNNRISSLTGRLP